MISLLHEIFKNDKNEPSYKREIDLQTQETSLWLPKGKELERDKFRVLGLTYTHCCKLLLSHFSHVQLCATPQMAGHQAPLST